MATGTGMRQAAVLAGVAVALALGTVQGTRLDGMRELERAYRWAVTASTFAGFGESLEAGAPDGSLDPVDDELFAKLTALGETALPGYIAGEDDVDPDGNPLPKLVLAVRQNDDQAVYNMMASAAGRELVGEYTAAANAGRIASIGSQFSTSSLYSEGGQAEGVGITSLFLGFRKVAANFLWMQVDSFWHSGQMHRMVPAMRTTVALDPQFVDAYLLGAWHLAYNLTAHLPDTPEPQKEFNEKYKKRMGPKEEWYYIAADFLKDGIRKNPRDYRVHFDLGYSIYENKLNDHANAVVHLKEARRYKHDRWVPRMLYLAMWHNGQYDEAIEGWLDYLSNDPNNFAANRFLRINRAYLAETKSDQANECMRAAQAESKRLAAALEGLDPQSAEAADLRAKKDEADRVALEMDGLSRTEWSNAEAIYAELIENEDDSIATARMLRHESLEYAREGRHLEAVMKLDLARYEMMDSFDELSDLRIKIKQQGNLPLEITEQLAVERAREAAVYAEPARAKAKRFVECQYAVKEGLLGLQ